MCWPLTNFQLLLVVIKLSDTLCQICVVFLPHLVDQLLHLVQGPTSTLYSNQTQIFLSYSNPTRKFLKNDRVASSVYYSHFRKIAARPASQYYSLMDTALVEILSFISSLSSATNLVFYIIFNFRNKQN